MYFNEDSIYERVYDILFDAELGLKELKSRIRALESEMIANGFSKSEIDEYVSQIDVLLNADEGIFSFCFEKLNESKD